MSTQIGYADLKQTKQRLNIPDTRSESNEKIETNMSDADAFINTQINVHAVAPVSPTAIPDKQLIALASGLAASLFNYWNTPAKDRTLDGIKQWEKRIGDYVKAVYGQEDITGHTGATFTTSRGVTGTESGPSTTT